MELGEKLRLARLEAGLSQRALCGDEITRNMLSRIENGAARPSMKTLRFLAARLDKPVSYFLEEDTVCSPNQESMTAARRLFDLFYKNLSPARPGPPLSDAPGKEPIFRLKTHSYRAFASSYRYEFLRPPRT